jgi:serine/threonine protein kinase
MAPEQFQNRATLQTDLYGLGGTMLYMLSGHPPSYFPQVCIIFVLTQRVEMIFGFQYAWINRIIKIKCS